MGSVTSEEMSEEVFVAAPQVDASLIVGPDIIANDADAVTNLATGNTSHFLPAGETQNLGITGVDITRMDFRNTSDDGAVTNTVYVSGFPIGVSAFK